jgi:hypothetical protein
MYIKKKLIYKDFAINISLYKHLHSMNIEKYRILGITGKKFSGKDTLGDYFVKNYGYERIAYADALKEAVKCIFDLDDEQLNGSKKEEIDEFWQKTPREILQYVGTNLLIPDVGKNIWVYVVKRKIINKLKQNPNAKFIITDARFHNEVNIIKELGGTVLKLKRNVNSNEDTHESETLIDSLPSDYEFNNNSTKENLYEKITKDLGFI